MTQSRCSDPSAAAFAHDARTSRRPGVSHTQTPSALALTHTVVHAHGAEGTTSEVGMADTLTANLDEACYSVRDFLAVLAVCRQERQPINVAIDRLLDMVGDA